MNIDKKTFTKIIILVVLIVVLSVVLMVMRVRKKHDEQQKIENNTKTTYVVKNDIKIIDEYQKQVYVNSLYK